MKNKIILVVLGSTLAIFGVFGVANAQEEAINIFESKIQINTDNSIDVEEIISYETSDYEERHGIYRDIYPYSSTKYKMEIDDVSVTDENGEPYIFEIYNEDSDIRIKIGDPEKTFSGEKIYIIKYHATQAIAQFEDFDEIYWNVTGSRWQMPIYQARATVLLPNGASVMQASCYYGPEGSTSGCTAVDNAEDLSVNFFTPSSVGAGEGFTVAVGFPKGFVVPYTASDKVSNFFDKYWRWMVSGMLPILTLFFCLRHWHKKGRDPKGRGVIVPQYDVPEDLTPMEAVGIVNEKVTAGDISAEIIYLATKGYLKINQTEERTLGIFKSTDYELLKLKDFSDLPNEFDKKLLNSLFEGGVQAVKLSELKNVFYKEIGPITTSVMENLLNKNYYKNLGNIFENKISIIISMSLWAMLAMGNFIFRNKTILPFVLSVGLSIIIIVIISRFFPAKTEKGVELKEYILGLKDYLRIAEKDRLIFHNAPEKKPEVFEKLLPFAMVLGVANIWAKEFEDIYITPPSWYSGSGSSAFNAVAFNSSLSNFSAYASSSLSSSPSGSGSGGGGFSGGGGGGGGGGSW